MLDEDVFLQNSNDFVDSDLSVGRLVLLQERNPVVIEHVASLKSDWQEYDFERLWISYLYKC